MSETLHLGLPFIAASQAQKHVTHNEALLKLDGLVHAHVERRDLTAPPANPQQGSAYLVAANPTGDWQAHENKIAAFQDGAWAYSFVKVGFVLWVVADELLAVWSGSLWLNFAAVGNVPSQVSQLGINAAPDNTNRLSVASPAVLFNHAGSDVQHKLNKNLAGDTASTLFQTGFLAVLNLA